MRRIDDIYNTRIMELAAAIPRTERLARPDATVSANSKLCGSTITIDVVMDGDRVADYGQTVKACMLGQATASIVGREIIGATRSEIYEAGQALRALLNSAEAPPPAGRFAELEVLQPVRHYRARHGSVMLVFDALARAFAELDARPLSSAGAPVSRG